jgi:hypothetical protein
MQMTAESLGVKQFILLLAGASVLALCSIPALMLVAITGGGGDAGTSPVGGGSFSVLGPPTVNAAFIDKVLAANHSPAQGTGIIFYTSGIKYGIDPVFALAFFKHESGFGTAGVARYTLSIGNSRCINGYPCYNGFRKFNSWAESIDAWFKMIRTLYVGQWNKSTIQQIIPTYAPPSDGNDVNGYIADIQKSVTTWRSGKI